MKFPVFDYQVLGCFNLKRWILPVWVLGKASMNLTERGYL
jgi:hypothetical protein